MKKMKHKIIFVILGIGILFSVVLLGTSILNEKPNNKIDCNNLIFLRHSEINQASSIAKKTNGLVIIPEDNEVIGNVNFLNSCPNINVLEYLKKSKEKNLNSELNKLKNKPNFDGNYFLEVNK